MDWSLVVLFTILCISSIQAVIKDSLRCPTRVLKGGRVRIRSRGRVAKYVCRQGYQVLGDKYSTCVRGRWDTPVPVCIKSGCLHIDVPNGQVIETYRGAFVTIHCDEGFSLVGSQSLYCNGANWNDTVPTCREDQVSVQKWCDFESEDLCGWTHDSDWQRHNFATPSGHTGTGPSYDHTRGPSLGGYYMYMETSSPRMENGTARMFSPIFPANIISSSCFIFWYHMFGPTTGTLNVYLHKQDGSALLFSKSGDHGDQWLRAAVPIPSITSTFQIVIEGVRGLGQEGDLAIDDVNLTDGDECSSLHPVTSIQSTDASQATYTILDVSSQDAINKPIATTTEVFMIPKPPREETVTPNVDNQQSFGNAEVTSVPLQDNPSRMYPTNVTLNITNTTTLDYSAPNTTSIITTMNYSVPNTTTITTTVNYSVPNTTTLHFSAHNTNTDTTTLNHSITNTNTNNTTVPYTAPITTIIPLVTNSKRDERKTNWYSSRTITSSPTKPTTVTFRGHTTLTTTTKKTLLITVKPLISTNMSTSKSFSVTKLIDKQTATTNQWKTPSSLTTLIPRLPKRKTNYKPVIEFITPPPPIVFRTPVRTNQKIYNFTQRTSTVTPIPFFTTPNLKEILNKTRNFPKSKNDVLHPVWSLPTSTLPSNILSAPASSGLSKLTPLALTPQLTLTTLSASPPIPTLTTYKKWKSKYKSRGADEVPLAHAVTVSSSISSRMVQKIVLVCSLLLILSSVLITVCVIRKRRINRRSCEDDELDIRFLASDEILDFTLARPSMDESQVR